MCSSDLMCGLEVLEPQYEDNFQLELLYQLLNPKMCIRDSHYVVQETEAAEGYELDATPYDVYLQWGKTTQIKLKNKELGSLSLVKVSAENEKQALPGASFLLYDEKGSLIGEYTTDENGEILLDHVLKAGIYTLRELSLIHI